jgi:hypothetical protein
MLLNAEIAETVYSIIEFAPNADFTAVGKFSRLKSKADLGIT